MMMNPPPNSSTTLAATSQYSRRLSAALKQQQGKQKSKRRGGRGFSSRGSKQEALGWEEEGRGGEGEGEGEEEEEEEKEEEDPRRNSLVVRLHLGPLLSEEFKDADVDERRRRRSRVEEEKEDTDTIVNKGKGPSKMIGTMRRKGNIANLSEKYGHVQIKGGAGGRRKGCCCCCCGHTNHREKWMHARDWVLVVIVTKPWFERFILFSILVNCIFLAMSNPTLADDDPVTVTVEMAEIIFAVIFTLEMVLKMMAMGLRGEATINRPAGYFSDSWNVLDFIIVVSGYVALSGTGGGGGSSIRILRVLRPLRTLNSVPGLRIMVSTLLDSLRSLADVGLLVGFLFIIFAIMGLQLWNGLLHQRCYPAAWIATNPKSVPDFLASAATELCALGDAPSGHTCLVGTSCAPLARNPNLGFMSFDHIFSSLLVVYQMCSLADWTDTMYALTEVWGGICWVYFLVLILFTTFFAINLVLAVIYTEFQEANGELQEAEEERRIEKRIRKRLEDQINTAKELGIEYDPDAAAENRFAMVVLEAKRRYQETHAAQGDAMFKNEMPVEEEEEEEQEEEKEHHRVDIGGVAAGTEKETVERYHGLEAQEEISPKAVNVEMIALAGFDAANSKSNFGGGNLNDVFADDNQGLHEMQLLDEAAEQKVAEFQSLQDQVIRDHELAEMAIDKANTGFSMKVAYLRDKPMWVRNIYHFCEHKYFTAFIILCIVLNTVLLALEHHGMSQSLVDFLEGSNYALTAIFAAEMVLKLIGYGYKLYLSDGFNVFDAVIVIISLLEVSVLSGQGGGVSALRAFRLLRVFKLAKNLKSLQILLGTVAGSITQVCFMTLLLLLFVFMFAVLGVQLFAGKFSAAQELNVRSRFDSLYWSHVTVFQILTGDDWPRLLAETHQAAGGVAVAFFLVLTCFGSYVVLSLFVSVILSAFDSQDEEQFELQTLFDEARILLDNAYHAGQRFDREQAIQFLAKNTNVRRQKAQQAKRIRVNKRKRQGTKQIKKCQGVSCRIWPANSPFRQFIFKIATASWFEWFIFLAIFVNCFFLALENPGISSNLEHALFVADVLFTIIFSLELIIKVIALGFYKGDYAYLADSWNRLDAFVVVVSLISLSFPSVSVFRSFRAVRPVRVIVRSPSIKVVVSALYNAIPAIANVFTFSLLFFLIFGILGVNLFAGKLRFCSTDPTLNEVECANAAHAAVANILASNGTVVVANLPRWENHPQNFDDIVVSMQTLFQVATLSSWTKVMYSAMDATEVGKAPIRGHNGHVSLFFLLFVVVCSFFALQLFIGVVIDNFNRLKQEYDGSALMTEAQLRWVQTQKLIASTKLRGADPQPENAFRNWCFRLVKKPGFDWFIMFMILFNTLTMTFQHYGQSASMDSTLVGFNIMFVVIFTCEAILKISGLGFSRYWVDSWNRFDFVLVLASFPGFFISAGVGPNVIRVFRVGRIFRLVKRAENLQRLFETLVFSAPSLINIGAFLGLVFYIAAILAVSFFGKVAFSENGLTEHANFRSFGIALLTLFRLATSDGWHEIPNGCQVQEPLCSEAQGNCGTNLAPIFFTLFMVVGGLVMTNLYIAVILEQFGGDSQADRKMFSKIREWTDVWEELDPESTEILRCEDFITLMEQAPLPFGFGQKLPRHVVQRRLAKLHLDIFLLPDPKLLRQLSKEQERKDAAASAAAAAAGAPPASADGCGLSEDSIQWVWCVRFQDSILKLVSIIAGIEAAEAPPEDEADDDDEEEQGTDGNENAESDELKKPASENDDGADADAEEKNDHSPSALQSILKVAPKDITPRSSNFMENWYAAVIIQNLVRAHLAKKRRHQKQE